MVERADRRLRLPSKLLPDRDIVAAHRGEFSCECVPMSDAT
jgi:hypothetical protein